MLSSRRILGWLTLAGLVGAMCASALNWMGGGFFGPGRRIDQLATRLQRVEVKSGNTALLVEGLVVKTCLDADSSAVSRNDLARAGIPCEALFKSKGLRPGGY